MQIRQLAVQYDAQADRLLLRVRSSADQVFAVWLTRRLCLRLWPHLSSLVQRAGASQLLVQRASQAVPTPDAVAMLAETARERTLAEADFSQPFEAAGAQQPLGAEPLLAHTVHLTPRSGGSLQLAVVDAQRRSLQLELDAALGTAVRELVAAALRRADWGIDAGAAPAAGAAAAPRLLN